MKILMVSREMRCVLQSVAPSPPRRGSLSRGKKRPASPVTRIRFFLSVRVVAQLYLISFFLPEFSFARAPLLPRTPRTNNRNISLGIPAESEEAAHGYAADVVVI